MGYPDPAVLPCPYDASLLLALAICSFIGQTLLNRSFQITSAAKGSSLMCTQVGLSPQLAWVSHGPLLISMHLCSLACLADRPAEVAHPHHTTRYCLSRELMTRNILPSVYLPGRCACLQVLHAHVFGIFLLDEHESLWGILGSILIAAGVVTVNGAKSGRSSGGGPPCAGVGCCSRESACK